MRRICAWCKKDIGSPDILDGVDIDVPITHGICGDCARKTLSFKAKSIKDILDQFSKPVFLLNSDGRVVCGNNAGLSLLKKSLDEIGGKLGGEAFSCKYADLPGGCGNTIHCKTCTIRNTVMDTLESGKSNIGIPAYPDLHHITKENRIRFLITTERVGKAVLLRIDDVTEEGQAQQVAPADADEPRR